MKITVSSCALSILIFRKWVSTIKVLIFLSILLQIFPLIKHFCVNTNKLIMNGLSNLHVHKPSQMVSDRKIILSKIVRYLSRNLFSTKKNCKTVCFQRVIERFDVKLDIFEAELKTNQNQKFDGRCLVIKWQTNKQVFFKWNQLNLLEDYNIV